CRVALMSAPAKAVMSSLRAFLAARPGVRPAVTASLAAPVIRQELSPGYSCRFLNTGMRHAEGARCESRMHDLVLALLWSASGLLLPRNPLVLCWKVHG